MNKLLRLMNLLFVLMLSSLAQAEVHLIVNESVTDSEISKALASEVFLGKVSKLPSGAKVKPVDQESGEAARDEFYSKVVNKTAAQLKSYWSGLIFTGKGMPPKALLDDDEVKEFVAANPGAIGYVSDASDLSGTKVVFSAP